MKNSNIQQRAFSGVLWKFVEKIGTQLIQFIIQIVLARMLMPEDYGIVGLLTIFITISDVFIQQGFTTALIQKKDVDEVDFSSVYFANIIMAVIIYIVLFATAPLVSIFYNEANLTMIMRVMSINVIFGSICAVHNAIMAKNLDFKKSFFRNLANIFTQGVVGITFAYMNFGVWALVFSKIFGTLVGAFVLCFTVKWKPKAVLSFKRVKSLFHYSSKLLGTNLLNTLFNNIHSLIIGRYFPKSELGYYQRGQQIPQAFMTAIDGSLNEVLYPTLSIMQDDKKRLKSALQRSMKTSMFITLPILMGVLSMAEPLTIILLTEKWLPSVPFMQLTCIICSFWPLSARSHALNAIGRSDVTFKLSIIAKGLTLFFIIICIKFGVYAIMLGTLCASFITVWITSYYVNKYINYSIKELIVDLAPSVILSIIMLITVMLIGRVKLFIYLKLIIQIITAIIIYVGGARLFKVDSYLYLSSIIKKRIIKKGT